MRKPKKVSGLLLGLFVATLFSTALATAPTTSAAANGKTFCAAMLTQGNKEDAKAHKPSKKLHIDCFNTKDEKNKAVKGWYQEILVDPTTFRSSASISPQDLEPGVIFRAYDIGGSTADWYTSSDPCYGYYYEDLMGDIPGWNDRATDAETARGCTGGAGSGHFRTAYTFVDKNFGGYSDAVIGLTVLLNTFRTASSWQTVDNL